MARIPQEKKTEAYLKWIEKIRSNQEEVPDSIHMAFMAGFDEGYLEAKKEQSSDDLFRRAAPGLSGES